MPCLFLVGNILIPELPDSEVRGANLQLIHDLVYLSLWTVPQNDIIKKRCW